LYYFSEILLAPFVVLNQYGRFDVTVETKGYGGMIAIPRAVRHAVSLCVAALVDDDQKEKLRLGMTRTMCTNIFNGPYNNVSFVFWATLSKFITFTVLNRY